MLRVEVMVSMENGVLRGVWLVAVKAMVRAAVIARARVTWDVLAVGCSGDSAGGQKRWGESGWGGGVDGAGAWRGLV